MRIGLYIPGIDKPLITGPTKYQINLARALAYLNEIELSLLHHRNVYLPNIKAKHIIINDKKPILWEVKLRKCNLDIIHFNLIPTTTRRIFFPILNCKKVATVHGDLHWLRETFADYNRPDYRIRRLMEPWVSKFMDAIIVVSNDLKRRLAQHLKAPETKTEVVHEGVSSAYKPLKNVTHIREKYHISRPFIFHVSNLSPKKNPQALLKTFNQLIKKGLDLELVIAGARWTSRYVKSTIEKLNLAPKIKILGYIPEQDLIYLYNAAELFFYPSLHETFGFPVLEAMACGTPVVTSNAYAIPEIAGDAATLCDPYDYGEFLNAIEQVLEGKKLRKEMIMKGLKNAKRFSWEKCAKETTKIYKQLLIAE